MAVPSRLSPLFSVVLLLAASLRAADAPPAPTRVAADVVVTAEAEPVEQKSLAVAATVIDADEIQRSATSNVLDLLRRVPSLDVVQSGGPGKVTSLFLRGTNSNQTLVLVDGVKLNTPYFGGIDLAGLSTANLERIEVLRGPFSALYGSEAIGGVIQLFTKRGG
ncbi:MAG: TonB-dependent receptor plug domain-containing protein, partial [Thermoanaerobaculia bacterium]